MVSSTAERGASSLLDKYMELQRGIDTAREETVKCDKKIEAVESRIVKLMGTREQMTVQTQAAKEEQKQLLQHADEALQESLKLEKDYEAAALQKHNAKALLDSARQRENQYRQSFVESSKAFRESCRQLCIQGENAGIQGLEPYALAKDEPKLLAAFQVSSQIPNDEDKYFANQMELLQRKLEEQTKAYEMDKKERDMLAARKAEILARDDTTNSQKSRLQAQLDKILNGIANLNMEISETREQTQEVQAMAATYEKDVKQRRLGASGVRGTGTTTTTNSTSRSNTRNPYASVVSTRLERRNSGSDPPPVDTNDPNDTAVDSDDDHSAKKSSSRSRPKNRFSTNKRRKAQDQQHQNLQATRFPMESSMTSTSQYPHRVGKPRQSRAFGFTMRLANPTTSKSTSSLSPVAATGVQEPAYVTPAPEKLRKSRLQKATNTDIRKDSISTGRHHRPTIVNDDDSDDDDGDSDDDGVLSFVAFGSSKK